METRRISIDTMNYLKSELDKSGFATDEDALGKMTIVNEKKTLFVNTAIILAGGMAFLNEGLRYPASIIAAMALIYAFSKRKLLFCLPPLIMFYEYLVLPGGLAVYRLFTLLFLIKEIKKCMVPIPQRKNLVFLVISALFLSICLGVADLRRIVFLLFDLITIALYVEELRQEEYSFRYFSYSMIAAVIFACFVGVVGGATEISGIKVNGEWIANTRLVATFTDSNYLSLFINLAFFLTLLSEKLHPIIRTSVLAGLFFFLIATGSFTGIIAMILGLLFFLFVTHKINIKTLLIIIISFIVLYRIYIFALDHDLPYITSFLQRIQSKIQVGSDTNALTSNRADIWKEHWEYYLNQNLFKQLFGGNVICAALIDTSVFHYFSHQEYIDTLLCYGAIGFILTIVPNFFYMLSMGFRSIRDGNKTCQIVFMMKFLYFFYAFGLTMLLDPKFLLFILI